MTLLEDAIQAIRSGDRTNGQRLLGQALQQNPHDVHAWLWMSAVLTDPQRKRQCLQKVLQLDPNNQAAQKGLQQLTAAARPTPAPSLVDDDELTPMPAARLAPPPPPTPAVQPPQRPAAPPNFVAAPAPNFAAPPAPDFAAPPPPTSSTTPTFESFAPPEAAAPDHQVWLAPKSLFGRVIMLLPQGLLTLDPPKKELPQIEAVLKQALPLLPPNVSPLAFESIQSVNADRRNQRISITYTQDKRARQKTIELADDAQRDEVFIAIRKHLGESFKYSLQRYSALQAVVAPLIVLLVLSFFTWLFYAGAAEAAAGGPIDIPGRHTLLKSLAAGLMLTLGPGGILGLGSVLALPVVAWAVARVRRPPIMMRLERVRGTTAK